MRPGSSARLRLLAAAALFSTGGAAIKACAFTALQVASLRSGVAALALLVALPAARAWPSRRQWLVGAAYATTMILYVMANKLTTAANTIFLQSTAPLYILLAAPFLLGERITRRDLLFMLSIVGGLSLLFVDESRAVATARNPFVGNLLAIGSGVFWAATVIGLRWLGRKEGERGSQPIGAVVAGNVLSFATCAAFAFPIESARPVDWAVIAYLGVFQIALAYVLVTRALAVLPAFEASLILLIEPVLNPLWAWIVHGEEPGAWSLFGGAILVTATLVKTVGDARASSRVAARAT
jgi:drug/metabolite transporter (DMT)-like permease